MIMGDIDMKIIAFYLPQYHEIPENNRWWGKGFTEWYNVTHAGELFEGHYQPRVPFRNNYYDLTETSVFHWQVSLAQKYGIYGFCMYHYWFQGKLLLEKPLELYREQQGLKFPFCICWANENWTKSWNVRSQSDILIRQTYGDEAEWKAHFEYLYPYLSDERYIQKEGKPLLVIYRPEQIPRLKERLAFWNRLAQERGLPGIAYASQQRDYNIAKDEAGEMFACQIEYQPAFVRDRLGAYFSRKNGVNCVDYDGAWEEVLHQQPLNGKSVPGAFVDWDNTPRKGKNGVVFTGAAPEKFEYYIKRQMQRARKVYHTDMLFLFAWNEWSEGGYLEPDQRWKYGYLEKLRNALRGE